MQWSSLFLSSVLMILTRLNIPSTLTFNSWISLTANSKSASMIIEDKLPNTKLPVISVDIKKILNTMAGVHSYKTDDVIQLPMPKSLNVFPLFKNLWMFWNFNISRTISLLLITLWIKLIINDTLKKQELIILVITFIILKSRA